MGNLYGDGTYNPYWSACSMYAPVVYSNRTMAYSPYQQQQALYAAYQQYQQSHFTALTGTDFWAGQAVFHETPALPEPSKTPHFDWLKLRVDEMRDYGKKVLV